MIGLNSERDKQCRRPAAPAAGGGCAELATAVNEWKDIFRLYTHCRNSFSTYVRAKTVGRKKSYRGGSKLTKRISTMLPSTDSLFGGEHGITASSAVSHTIRLDGACYAKVNTG